MVQQASLSNRDASARRPQRGTIRNIPVMYGGQRCRQNSSGGRLRHFKFRSPYVAGPGNRAPRGSYLLSRRIQADGDRSGGQNFAGPSSRQGWHDVNDHEIEIEPVPDVIGPSNRAPTGSYLSSRRIQADGGRFGSQNFAGPSSRQGWHDVNDYRIEIEPVPDVTGLGNRAPTGSNLSSRRIQSDGGQNFASHRQGRYDDEMIEIEPMPEHEAEIDPNWTPWDQEAKNFDEMIEIEPVLEHEAETDPNWTPWDQEAKNFEANFDMLANKIQRFPRSLQGLKSYITPKAVAIGPYHHLLSTNLTEMEEVKKVAADQFVKKSTHTFGDIHDAVAEALGAAHDFYDWNVVQGGRPDNFVEIMFLDGCFLMQYMECTCRRGKLPRSGLSSFFDTNQAVISEDIMLLENQLPWVVLSTLNEFVKVPVEEFVGKMGRTLQIRKDIKDQKLGFVVDDSYRPRHLLDLLWHYKTGSLSSKKENKTGSRKDEKSSDISELKPVSRTISAIELAEIGIGLKASKTEKFTDMGINKVPLFTNIFLPPVLLDHVRASWLVNMVAFEECLGMARDTRNPSVVSSYIAILAMLMDREEDVHKLRADGVVQGELTNKEMLDFFKTVIKHISGGDPYSHIIKEVEDYKAKCWMWIIVHKFFYKNWKTIAAVLTIVAVLLAILNLKRHW